METKNDNRGSQAASNGVDLSKLERLRGLQELTNNEHGIGHVETPEGARIVITSPDKSDVVTIPSSLSKQDFEALKKKLLPISETQLMLFELGLAYANRTPIMLEGGTAIGKTFAVNTFAQLLYGPRAKIPDFYCNGQTDVSELMGKYVPAGLNPEQLKRINDYLKSDAGAALQAEMGIDGSVVDTQELIDRAALELGIPIPKGSFSFQLGVLPKAMTGTMSPEGVMLETQDGPGCMLHIQEVGMAAPSVINALLKIRGTRGKLAEDIQVHEDGGRLIEAGEGFFIVMSTNPPGKGFKERFDIDSALARALVWKTLPDELSSSSMKLVASKVFDFSQVERREDAEGAVVDLSKHPELAEVLGLIAYRFHRMYQDKLREGEPGRKQKVPATLDSLWKVAELVQNHQILHDTKGQVDLVKTMKQAIRGTYVDALRDKPQRFPTESLEETAAQERSIGAALLKGLDEILSDTKFIELRHKNKKVSPAEKINLITEEIFRGASTGSQNATQLAKEAAKQVRASVETTSVMQDLGDYLPADLLSELHKEGKK